MAMPYSDPRSHSLRNAFRCRRSGAGCPLGRIILALLATSLGVGAEAPVAQPTPPPPKRAPVVLAEAGEAGVAIDRPDGTRVRNLFALKPLAAGAQEVAWDLRDDLGQLVEPGRYVLKMISAPPIELSYGMTPYPNVDQLHPDRAAWLTSHDGHDGWLADHGPNWACATVGDKVWFGATIAEAGVSLIECDLDGRKQWGRHDFGAWCGVQGLAADDRALYVNGNGAIHRLDPATRASREIFRYDRDGRHAEFRAMAAYAGRVYIALGPSGADAFAAPCTSDTIAYESCQPVPPDGGAFAALLRFGGRIPGRDVDPRSGEPQGTGRLYLESTMLEAEIQYAIIAFRQPIALGAVAFPAPDGLDLQLSVLNADAAWPPVADEEEHWIAFADAPKPGFNVLPAPERTTTRALRIAFTKSDAAGFDPTPWLARLEGMKLLRRRYADVAGTAAVAVSSGVVDDHGVWDAQRVLALGADDPSVYRLQWPAPVALRGLAFKEVDAARCAIDVWQGPLSGEAPLDGPAQEIRGTATGWRQVATYDQPRRRGEYGPQDNPCARYLDGWVDFGDVIATAAVRVRLIEPWLDRGGECRRLDGALEHGVHIQLSSIAKLDPRRAGIQNVCALSPLGGEPDVGGADLGRIAVYDGETGAPVGEIPTTVGWHCLTFGPDGALYATDLRHQHVVRVDQETGAQAIVIADASPNVFTTGPDGRFYVHPWTNSRRDPIAVYAADGAPLGRIGEPGGFMDGPWDPRRFGDVHRLCVDRAGSLWVVETQEEPRRITQWNTADGALVREILGNTNYGGGGSLDRYDPTRAYKGAFEFELDWKSRTSRIRNRLAPGVEGDLTARRVDGRSYLVSTPLTMEWTQGRAVVYRKDEASGTVRMVGAIGAAAGWGPARNAAVLNKLDGDVPANYRFAWSDADDDGAVDPEEVRFAPRPEGLGRMGMGPFDDQLGCVGFGRAWTVESYTAGGAPLWREEEAPSFNALARLDDGSFIGLASTFDSEREENWVVDPAGRKRWSYAAHGGVSGLAIPPWIPGSIGTQFAMIGHERAPEGDLGEFFVCHHNTGQWSVWTADGLLAGQLLLHRNDPRARFLGPSPATPGMRLDPLSANQEHFHGHFARIEGDGAYRLIMGFTTMSIMEVRGLERFRRQQVAIDVSASDLEQATAWAILHQQAERDAEILPAKAVRRDMPPLIDGLRDADEWPGEGLGLRADDERVRLDLAYDDENLYLCCVGVGVGRFANAIEDPRRMFKTGAAFDLRLQTDPGADPGRVKPAAGDLRLLIGARGGVPRAVLYQPVRAGAAASEAWLASTPAGGETRFDRVVELALEQLAMQDDGDAWTVEAAIPLTELGLEPTPGQRLRFDWGVLTTADGYQVKDRMAWADTASTGTSDEAVEARLEPGAWGILEF